MSLSSFVFLLFCQFENLSTSTRAYRTQTRANTAAKPAATPTTFAAANKSSHILSQLEPTQDSHNSHKILRWELFGNHSMCIDASLSRGGRLIRHEPLTPPSRPHVGACRNGEAQPHPQPRVATENFITMTTTYKASYSQPESSHCLQHFLNMQVSFRPWSRYSKF